AGGWPGWTAFREQLKGVLAVSDYSFLSNPAMAEGRFDGSRLTLWAANDFLRDMLDRPAITRPMAELCQRLTGVARQVEVKMGKAPPEDAPDAAPAMDALDAFLAQAGDNIIVE
ncbi:MAG: DNA polymerase III subunit gamma/tau, partial [Oscillospiraceae bacterium]|nr:DNA polymerase III subunit gamma/tau [Oscillospiraceae bacterium]